MRFQKKLQRMIAVGLSGILERVLLKSVVPS